MLKNQHNIKDVKNKKNQKKYKKKDNINMVIHLVLHQYLLINNMVLIIQIQQKKIVFNMINLHNFYKNQLKKI